MSEMPQPPVPPAPVLLPSARPPARWPGYIAWGIILLVAGFIIASNVSPELRGRSGAAADTSDVQMTLSAKYSLGLRGLLPTTPAATLMQQLDKIAGSSPRQQIHAAVVAAELEGGDAALKRLSRIGPATQAATASPATQPASTIALLQTVYTSSADALDQTARQELIAEHGFFGRLALSYQQPDGDSMRQAVLAQARKTALIAIGFFGSISAAVIGGLVLLVIGVVMLVTGSLRTLYSPDPSAGTVYLEAFAVYLLGYVALSLVVSALSRGQLSVSATWALAPAVPLAIFWAMARGQSWETVRQALGWHAGRGLHIEIPLGIVGYIAGLPVVFAGFLLTLLLMRFTSVPPSHPIQNAPTDTALDVLQLLGIASVFAPIVEETMFRGALLHHLRRRWNWPISAVVVAVIFAAIHPQGWAAIPVLGSIAIVLAGLREWRGSIIAPVIAHACNNGVVMMLFVLAK